MTVTMLIVLTVIAMLYMVWMLRRARKRMLVRAATIASVGFARHDEPPLT
jgi:uncharacterized membrane protein YqjE